MAKHGFDLDALKSMQAAFAAKSRKYCKKTLRCKIEGLVRHLSARINQLSEKTHSHVLSSTERVLLKQSRRFYKKMTGQEHMPAKVVIKEPAIYQYCCGDDMCHYKVTPKTRICPVCGCRDIRIEKIEEAPLLVPSRLLVTENLSISAFA